MNKQRKKVKLIYGWGVNDSVDNVYIKNVDGKYTKCPYYSKWLNVIGRCKSEKVKSKNKTYINATVCDDWRYFSNFKLWVDLQPSRGWESCDLDKDILIKGNMHYSPDTCVFVDHFVNAFMNDCRSARGDLMIGVCYHRKYGKYQASCRNPFTKKYETLGFYETELNAHLAWKQKKREHALALADLQLDSRVSLALKGLYL